MTRRPDEDLDETDVAEEADGGNEEADDAAYTDDDEEDDDDDADHFLLDEDSDAPNLVPEEHPRRLLAGRIEMLEKIGEGGMGAVWRGHHLNLDRVVAVKVLDEALQLRVDGRERFIREGKALALLDHRNVVRIFDCDQTPDGKLFLCMEMLEGETLRALIKRGVRPDPIEVIDIGLQVCDALAAAHRRGILHRDLTPSNIMRLRDSARTIKVIDWGLCKYLDLFYMRAPQKYGAPPGSRLVTPYGCRFGTPEYMAPELLRRENPGPPSFCTDVYALAVVLFELLTGRLPFVPGDPKKPRPIRSLLPSFEYQDLETALREALRFNPDDRTQTMAELREALDLARECLLAQREPRAVAGDGPTPVVAVAPADIPTAPEQVVVVAGRPREAFPGPVPEDPTVARSVGVDQGRRDVLPGLRPAAPPWPPARLALPLLLGVGIGVGGTLVVQHLGDGGASPSADLAMATAAVERPADRCEPASPPQPAVSPAAAQAGLVMPPVLDVSPPVHAVVGEPGALGRIGKARAERAPPAAGAAGSGRVQTFARAMGRSEPGIRDCIVRATGKEPAKAVEVRVRFDPGSGAIEQVRALDLGASHPIARCIDEAVRAAAPPSGGRPNESFTFFKFQGPGPR